MPKTVDPLQILKEHVIGKKKIEKSGGYLIFDNKMKLKMDIPTACVESQTGNPYSLGSLWFYLTYKDSSFTDYVNKALAEKLELINPLDKEKLNQYFLGNLEDEKDLIDQDSRTKTLVLLGRKRQTDPFETVINEEEYKDMFRVNDKDGDKNDIKLESTDPNLKVIEYLLKKERKLFNRNNYMKSQSLHSFENLFGLCKKHFIKSNVIKPVTIQTESMSFLDELTSIDDLYKRAIIVVPETFVPGNICLENAREFLFNGNYVDLDKPHDLDLLNVQTTFKHSTKDKELNFEIINNVRKLEKSDWKKVVAVFVQGNDWEFADWPKNETIINILLKVKGFHLKYNDLPRNDNVKKWNLKILEIHRVKRHQDGCIQTEFWKVLDEFLSLPRYREKNLTKK